MKTFLSCTIAILLVAAYFINEDNSEKYQACLDHNKQALMDSSLQVKSCGNILE